MVEEKRLGKLSGNRLRYNLELNSDSGNHEFPKLLSRGILLELLSRKTAPVHMYEKECVYTISNVFS